MAGVTGFFRNQALVAGVSLIAMAVLAPLGLLPVEALRGSSAEALAASAAAGLPGFGWAVMSWVGVVVLDIVVACALFLFLREGAGAASRLAAWLRLAYAAMLGAAVGSLAEAGALGRLADAAGAPAIRAALDRFSESFQLALIVFALHLIVLATALWISRRLPRWVAVLVGLSGVGYLADGIAHQLGGHLQLAMFTFGGEVVLAFCLIWAGVRAETKASRAKG